MAVPEIIVELVQRFDQHRLVYRLGEDYETSLRRATDHQIDALLYALCGLMEEEIKIVEGE
jgi:hypothetical protein